MSKVKDNRGITLHTQLHTEQVSGTGKERTVTTTYHRLVMKPNGRLACYDWKTGAPVRFDQRIAEHEIHLAYDRLAGDNRVTRRDRPAEVMLRWRAACAGDTQLAGDTFAGLPPRLRIYGKDAAVVHLLRKHRRGETLTAGEKRMVTSHIGTRFTDQIFLASTTWTCPPSEQYPQQYGRGVERTGDADSRKGWRYLWFMPSVSVKWSDKVQPTAEMIRVDEERVVTTQWGSEYSKGTHRWELHATIGVRWFEEIYLQGRALQYGFPILDTLGEDNFLCIRQLLHKVRGHTQYHTFAAVPLRTRPPQGESDDASAAQGRGKREQICGKGALGQ